MVTWIVWNLSQLKHSAVSNSFYNTLRHMSQYDSDANVVLQVSQGQGDAGMELIPIPVSRAL